MNAINLKESLKYLTLEQAIDVFEKEIEEFKQKEPEWEGMNDEQKVFFNRLEEHFKVVKDIHKKINATGELFRDNLKKTLDKINSCEKTQQLLKTELEEKKNLRNSIEIQLSEVSSRILKTQTVTETDKNQFTLLSSQREKIKDNIKTLSATFLELNAQLENQNNKIDEMDENLARNKATKRKIMAQILILNDRLNDIKAQFPPSQTFVEKLKQSKEAENEEKIIQ